MLIAFEATKVSQNSRAREVSEADSADTRIVHAGVQNEGFWFLWLSDISWLSHRSIVSLRARTGDESRLDGLLDPNAASYDWVEETFSAPKTGFFAKCMHRMSGHELILASNPSSHADQAVCTALFEY